jgi:protein-S-isoprenylcysteine O-methyltransferase Ste14
MSDLDRVEGIVRRFGGIVAISAAASTVPGVVRSALQRGPVSGRPELVFTPARLLAISVGWFGAMIAAWRPLPVRPSPAARMLLLGGGVALYVVGLSLAVAGRVALGTSYRPSSTLGVPLAPDHRLVTTGPYAVVRHPMYLGLALAAIGALAVYRTWSTLLFIVQLPVLQVRARREEELLAVTFGAAWRRYARRVPAWWPQWPRVSTLLRSERTDPGLPGPDPDGPGQERWMPAGAGGNRSVAGPAGIG